LRASRRVYQALTLIGKDRGTRAEAHRQPDRPGLLWRFRSPQSAV